MPAAHSDPLQRLVCFLRLIDCLQQVNGEDEMNCSSRTLEMETRILKPGLSDLRYDRVV